MEFALDCARLAREHGLKNVFVSNGYTSPAAIEAIAPFLDANNIDLKGDDYFYKNIAGAKLQPVLDTIRDMKSRGVWVEITTLLIPGLNDSDEFLRWAAAFIASVDPSIPWHVTGFHPTHKMLDRPSTPVEALVRARKIGLAAGLRYDYQGNMYGDGENTVCYSCGRLLIERSGFTLRKIDFVHSKCPSCNTIIEGIGLP
jgi:pyruvate formate lyase activating enzyme